MFENSKAYFSGEGSLQIDKNGVPSEEDLNIAVLALLITIGKADNNFCDSELREIVSLAASQLALNENEAGALLEVAEFMVDENKGKLHDFIARIRDNFDDIQRMRLLGMVWKVIAADGKLTEEEPRIAVAVRKDLNLTLEQAVRAQQMAQDGEYDIKVSEKDSS